MRIHWRNLLVAIGATVLGLSLVALVIAAVLGVDRFFNFLPYARPSPTPTLTPTHTPTLSLTLTQTPIGFPEGTLEWRMVRWAMVHAHACGLQGNPTVSTPQFMTLDEYRVLVGRGGPVSDTPVCVVCLRGDFTWVCPVPPPFPVETVAVIMYAETGDLIEFLFTCPTEPSPPSPPG